MFGKRKSWRKKGETNEKHKTGWKKYRIMRRESKREHHRGMRGGVEWGAGSSVWGKGAQKEAEDKVTRMDEGREWEWNRWRKRVENRELEERDEWTGEHVRYSEREKEGYKSAESVCDSVIREKERTSGWRWTGESERLKQGREGRDDKREWIECRRWKWLSSETVIKCYKEWPCNQTPMGLYDNWRSNCDGPALVKIASQCPDFWMNNKNCLVIKLDCKQKQKN